ncbi:MAG: 2-dehydropantoate 2-reductase [Ramlibacter sp.]|nr:2-dehydropantoate 2-reductase [Ramlibacter sp.]
MAQALNRICIYGAGAIGGWLGLRLAQAGCEVSVVARGATLEAVKANGLLLTQAASGATESVRVRASNSPAELGVQDAVVVAVKAPAMSDVAKSIAPLIGADTIVLTAMNGVPWWFFEGFGGKFQGHALKAVDPDGSIARHVPGKQIIGCVVHASCSLDGPGHVRQHFGNKLIVGEPSGEKTPRVRALISLLEGAGLEVALSEQIQRDAWFKLWGNMTMNPISAMTGATTDRVLDDDLVLAFIGNVMLEAKEIGARIGIPIDQQPQDRHAVTRKLGAFKTSMLQDVEAGKQVELDALVTVVKELGALTEVPTPYTDALLGLARLHARVRGLY